MRLQCVQLFEEARNGDPYKGERPFLALAGSDRQSDGLPRGHLHLYSIPKGTTRSIALQSPDDEVITEIASNGGWIAVASTHHKLYLIDIETLQAVRVINCWKDPDANHGPTFALGPKWLAFQSAAPLNGELDSSVAKKAKKVVDEDVAKEVKDAKKHGSPQATWTQKEMLALGYSAMREGMYLGSQFFTSVVNSYNGETAPTMSSAPGTVEIWNLPPLKLHGRVACIALFSADNRRLERMAFDKAGMILATAGDGGQSVKVWNIAHIISSISPNVIFNPMYILERGTTLGTISSMSFTDDSALLAFTTKPKGTIHVFPISLTGQEVGISTHLPSSIPDTWQLGEPRTDSLKPKKLSAIHSPASANTVFSGVSRLSTYPLTSTHSDQKRASHTHDRTIYAFYPNGTLMRQDFSFKTDPTLPSTLAMNIKPRYKWDLCRSTAGTAQFPVFVPTEHDLLDRVEEQLLDAGALLANVETQTHSIADSEGGSHLPKFTVYAYTELPLEPKDANSAWRDDSIFAALKPTKLHSPGLPGGTNKLMQQPLNMGAGSPVMQPMQAPLIASPVVAAAPHIAPHGGAAAHHHGSHSHVPNLHQAQVIAAAPHGLNQQRASPPSPVAAPSHAAPVAAPSQPAAVAVAPAPVISLPPPAAAQPEKAQPKQAAKIPAPVEPKVEAPKVEPKVEAPKAEPKVEPPKAEPKVEPKAEAPKAEPKVEPKVEVKAEPKVEKPAEKPVEPKPAEPAPAKQADQPPASSAPSEPAAPQPAKEEAPAPKKGTLVEVKPERKESPPIVSQNAFDALGEVDDDDEYSVKLPKAKEKEVEEPAPVAAPAKPAASAPQPAQPKGKKGRKNNNNNNNNNKAQAQEKEADDAHLSVSPKEDVPLSSSPSSKMWSDIVKK